MNSKTIITIGREKGSGGHYIGQLLAVRLGIKCYDNEILYETAKQSGFTKEFIEEFEEKRPSRFLYSLAMGNAAVSYNQPLHQQLYLAQTKVIKDIAERESCIFVGRCADYVLRDMPEVLRVFVHASMSDCVKRIQMTTNVTRQEAELLIMRTNKTRSEYYRHFTDKTWGNSKNYHLSIDSSDLTADGAADLIMEHLKIREKYQNR
ncbi:AAA family ATPase [Frisingicoccus sp.]|uniref:cytidylate kinase-like family protein n=1 Tax=Frisingicoccus sp. TaxID=1918627 RepID=UPI003AB3790D